MSAAWPETTITPFRSVAFDSGVGNNETISPQPFCNGDEDQGEGRGALGEGLVRGETDGREGRKSTAPDNGRQRLTTVPN